MSIKKTLSALAALFCIFSYTPLQSSPLILEEIIVTAQKREQLLIDIPGSVDVVSSKELLLTNTRDFSDLGLIASGIEIDGNPGGRNAQVRIRGIGTNKFAPGILPSVGIFIDDIALVNIGAAYNNLVDVERIEILKGPQSTLFGKGVSSGAISITTRQPDTEQTNGFINATIGNLGLQEYRLGGNLPLSDQLAVRASGYYAERDGDVENLLTGNEGAAMQSQGARIHLAWAPSKNFNARLGFENHDVDSESSSSVVLEYGNIPEQLSELTATELVSGEPFERETQNSAEDLTDSNTSIWSLHTDWDLNETWSLSSITAYQEYKREIGNSKLREDGSSDTAVSPFVLGPFNTLFDSDSFTQELRLHFDNDSWSVILGAYYSDSEIVSYTPLIRPIAVIPILGDPSLVQFAILSDIVNKDEEWAVFTHNTYHFAEDWSLTFGLRYSKIDKQSTSGTLFGQGKFAGLHDIPLVSNWDVPTQENDWDPLTGGLKLSYDLNDNVMVYLGYDRGFKAGGFQAASHDQSDVSGNSFLIADGFDEEIADNFEFGMKGFFLDRSLSLNAAVFYEIYDDFQQQVPDPVTTLIILQNAAEVSVTGAELDFRWLVGENLTLDGGIAYVDSKYDEYENAGCITPQFAAMACSINPDTGTLTQDLSNERINATARWTGNWNATWTDTFSDGTGWYLRGEIVYRGDRVFMADLDPASAADSYVLLNGSVGITAADGAWQASLWGKNLADEEYFVDIDHNRDFTRTGYAGYRAVAGLERTFGVTFEYRL